MKRLLASMLCILLLAVLLPVTAFAANTISAVSLSVAAPFHGQFPEKPTVNTEGVSVYAWDWKYNGNNMSSFETFEGGKTYTLKVRLTTLDSFSNNVSVKLGGLSAKNLQLEYNNTHIICEWDFYVEKVGYVLSFDPGNFGSGTMEPLTGKESYTLPKCGFTATDPTKEFSCWREDGTNELYQTGETIFLQKDTVVRAVWVTPTKTRIYDVEATSNIDSIPVLYQSLAIPAFTVTKGAPAYLLANASNMHWQKNVDGVWTTQYSGRFTPGQWRLETQLRIDHTDAQNYELGSPTSLKVNGVVWTMHNNGVPSVHNDYSMIAVTSPTFTIVDDPNIEPPENITSATIRLTGYKLGAKVQNAKVTCDDPNISVEDVVFIVAKDTNNDGIPDSAEPAGSTFEAADYAFSFVLKAKTGYDISSMTLGSVTCPGGSVLGSYSQAEDCYNGVCSLHPFETCTVSFAAGDGSGTMKAVTVEKGSYTLPENRFTAPEGKQFKAWSVGGQEKAPGSKLTVSADIKLTALWEDIPADHTCNSKPVEKLAPTCTEDGKEAYFRCEDCGKLYEDAKGKKEIIELSSWGKLEKLEHTDENGDGKCDACGFAITESTVPVSPTEPAQSVAPDTEATEDSAPGNEEAPSDINWLWIVAGILFAAIAATVAVIMIQKKGRKNNETDT